MGTGKMVITWTVLGSIAAAVFCHGEYCEKAYVHDAPLTISVNGNASPSANVSTQTSGYTWSLNG